MRLVLERVSVAGIHLKLGKCKFRVQEVDYLKMQDEKLATIRDWKDPENVQSFYVGFADFYRQFVSGVVAPVIKLTGQERPLEMRHRTKDCA